ncbi:hypothetical protein [Fodinicola feengrottensis]|uniref:hypothetical protein n=1 Tax=Fodinicola feengrottensis TaxID=435914 RepID=UPI0031E2EC56
MRVVEVWWNALEEPDSRWLRLVEDSGRWGVLLSATHQADQDDSVDHDDLGLWVSRDEDEARERLRYLLDACPAPHGWRLAEVDSFRK